MRYRPNPRDLVLVTLAAAHLQVLKPTELGRKAGNMDAQSAEATAGELSVQGLVMGSTAHGYALTEEGIRHVEQTFRRSQMGGYTSYSEISNNGGALANALRKYFPFIALLAVLLVAARGLVGV